MTSKSRMPRLFVTAILATFSLSAQAALVNPVDGRLSASAYGGGTSDRPPDVIFGASYGQFTNRAYAVSPIPGGAPGSGRADISANVNPNSVSLNGSAYGTSMGGATASATTQFNLTQAGAWILQFTAYESELLGLAGNISLSDSNGIVYQWTCGGGRTSCATPAWNKPLKPVTLDLGAGLHTLSLNLTEGSYWGSRAGGNGVLSLTPVPIPAALPLLATGLIGLATFARRRVTAV